MRKSLAALVLSAAIIGAATACAMPDTQQTRVPESPTLSVQPAAPVEPPTPTTVEMPSVEGLNLMAAMDTLENLGMTNIQPLPVDGHAFVANPANWVVVAQEPAADTQANTAGEVTLQVSKTDEAESSWCGDRDC
ncbi:PASTA domain-containing protein [Prauserella oleivorans]|uniref:PASTA domain-containing protein n=1 Tax=Prauserella oleivorans TaxID=1478153 RepID=A0ABW5WDN7_9PSEU